MRDAYVASLPNPATRAFAPERRQMVHEIRRWTDELRSLQVPTMLLFGDRDFSPLSDVVELFELLRTRKLAVLPGTTPRPGDAAAR